MATRVTDGARRERHPRFALLAVSPLPRACIALTKSEEKERLLAIYSVDYSQKTKTTTTAIVLDTLNFDAKDSSIHAMYWIEVICFVP